MLTHNPYLYETYTSLRQAGFSDDEALAVVQSIARTLDAVEAAVTSVQ